MKKSDLKTGMIVELRESSDKYVVLLNTKFGDIISNFGGEQTYNKLCHYSDNLTNEYRHIDICRVYDADVNILDDNKLLWERTPEKTYYLDGIEYSESTLRSIIKKATDK